MTSNENSLKVIFTLLLVLLVLAAGMIIIPLVASAIDSLVTLSTLL